MKSIRIWVMYSVNSFQQTLSNRIITVIFIFSKFIRIGLFLLFLSLLMDKSSGLAGYTKQQVIFFYLSFNLIDTGSQFFFRNVYSFRPLIISGDFDLVLSKPINPLIRVLLGGADIMDGFMLIIILSAILLVGIQDISSSPLSWLGFLILFLCSLTISASFHIVVLGIGVITASVDHLIMIYRDLTALMRIPVDAYIEPLRSVFTFLVPIGLMFTFPPKFLMGVLSEWLVGVSVIISLVALSLSLSFWKYSLRHYQSAGS